MGANVTKSVQDTINSTTTNVATSILNETANKVSTFGVTQQNVNITVGCGPKDGCNPPVKGNVLCDLDITQVAMVNLQSVQNALTQNTTEIQAAVEASSAAAAKATIAQTNTGFNFAQVNSSESYQSIQNYITNNISTSIKNAITNAISSNGRIGQDVNLVIIGDYGTVGRPCKIDQRAVLELIAKQASNSLNQSATMSQLSSKLSSELASETTQSNVGLSLADLLGLGMLMLILPPVLAGGASIYAIKKGSQAIQIYIGPILASVGVLILAYASVKLSSIKSQIAECKDTCDPPLSTLNTQKTVATVAIFVALAMIIAGCGYMYIIYKKQGGFTPRQAFMFY